MLLNKEVCNECNEYNKKSKGEKGSITIFVLLSMVFFVIILSGVYVASINKQKTSLGYIEKIADNYDIEDKEIDNVYNNIAYTNVTYVPVSDGEVPVPKEFYYVGGTISSGVVISDSALDENKYKYNQDVGTDLQGNQFVWVPCTLDGENNTTMYKQDKSDKYQSSYIVYEDWNDTGKDKDGNELENEIKLEKRETSVKKYGGFYVARYESGWSESIRDGSPYENNTEKNINTKLPISKAGVPSWNYISQINAKTVSNNMYKNHISVTSSLIDSYAWDTICNWLSIRTSEEIDSTVYGNYYTSDFEVKNAVYAKHVYISNGVWDSIAETYNYGTIQLPAKSGTYRIEISTGTSEDTKINNIYDLAGNMWEWTTETGYHGGTETSDLYVVRRGGSFVDFGRENPIVERAGGVNVGVTSVNVGFRPVLYIK